MKLKILTVLTLGILMSSCGGDKAKEKIAAPKKEEVKSEVEKFDPKTDRGIGPVSSVTIGDIDNNLVVKGEGIFKAKCTACHKISKKFVGPALKGVTERRTPEWIMNMILNPEEMVKNDPIAKQLLIDSNGAPMANQNLTEDEARAVLEYFRTKN